MFESLEPRTLLAGGPVISELLAINNNVLADEEGEFSDWLEIHNPTAAAIDLGGWYLTDKADHLTKWQLPAVSLAPDDYLVVFASGKDRTAPTDPLHTNFRLTGDGEFLALVEPDGQTIAHAFDPVFPKQWADISFGLGQAKAPSEDAPLLYFTAPTPGAANGAGFVGVTTEKVDYSRTSGTFSGSFELLLSTDAADGTIRYTLDGTLPTDASPAYGGPLTIGSTTQVRAMVMQPDMIPGPVKTEAFVRLGADVLGFSSQLPIMVIENFGGGEIPTAWSNTTNEGSVQVPRQAASLMLFEPTAGTTTLIDAPVLQSRIGIRGRGHSSSAWDEPGYSLDSWSDGPDVHKDISPLGLAFESDWILYAPNPNSILHDFDLTLMDNTFLFEISRQFGFWAPNVRYVEAFVNEDGGDVTMDDFVGIYVFTEKVERSDNRLDFDGFSPGGDEGGWLLSINRMDSIPVGGVGTPQFFHTAGPDGILQTPPNTLGEGDDIPRQYNAVINFEVPDGYAINATQRAEIEGWLRDMEDVLYDRTTVAWDDPIDGYAKYIDVDSFVDYFILHNLSKNGDGLLASMWVYNPDPNNGGKLTMGPIWDADLNSFTDAPTEGLMHRADRLWYGRMFQDPNFMQRYIDRWGELRSTVLSDQNMFATIDAIAATVGNEAAVRDEVTDWPARLQAMKDWLTARTGAIDSLYLTSPTFNQDGGRVTSGFGLTISAPTGTIYYTTDGTDPRSTGGGLGAAAQVYNGSPVVILQETVVRARAKSDGDWSGETSAVFSLFVPADATNLTVSEIHYNPAAPDISDTSVISDNEQYEFIEIHNFGSQTIDLNGVRFNNGVQFSFAGSNVTSLLPGNYAVVVANRQAFLSRYSGFDTSRIAGEFSSGRLSNGGEGLTLVNPSDEVIVDLDYDDRWHALSDGAGFSLARIDPTDRLADLNDKSAWRPSSHIHGSPGAADRADVPAPGAVVVNEVLAHSDAATGDWIELLNTTDAAIDISGWYLSDDENAPLKYQIPAETIIPAFGFVTFTQAEHFGASFALSEMGDDVVVQAVQGGEILGFRAREDFDASANGRTLGRYIKTNGGKDFVALQNATFGTANADPLVGPIVITEIMYNPGGEGVEFIELKNITDEDVPLFDLLQPANTWRLDGIAYQFPAGLTLPAGGLMLVVREDPAAFRSRTGVPGGVQIVGPFAGSLNNGGESLRLEMPGDVQPDLRIPEILVDRVKYDNAAPWPTEAAGGGASLVRIDTAGYGNDASNWRAGPDGGTPGDVVTRPANFSTVAVSSSQIDLSWSDGASEDGYRVYQWGGGRGVLIASLPADSTGHSVSSLSPETGYWFSVEAFNTRGSRFAHWTSATTRPASRPARPPDFSTAAASSTQIDLSWGDVAGENGYRVYQWQGSGVLIATLPAGSTSYSASSLSPETSYWFSVEAFNSAGSRYTPWTSTTTLPSSRPARPTDFSTVAVSSTQIDLSWGDVAGEDGYRVYQWQGAGVLIATLPAGSTGYSVSLLSPGTSYWFSVEAFNSAGSRYTPWTSTTTQTASPPAGPAGPANFTTEAISSTQIDLSWSDVAGEDGYRVYQWQGGRGVLIATLPADSTGYAVQSLAPNTSYWFSLDVFSASGSAWTPWTSAKTLPAPRPARADNFAAVGVSGTQIDLSWSDVAGEDGYRVYQWQSGGGVLIATLPADSTGYSAQSLAPNTSYWFSLEAFNASGSSWMPWTSATTQASPPARPDDFRVVPVSGEQINLSWNDVIGEDGYQLYQWKTGGGVLIATLPDDSTGYSVPSLSPNTLYWFTVEAFNSAGSSLTHWKSGLTLGTPAPTSPEPLSLVAADRLELTWTNSSFEEGYRLDQWAGSGSVLVGSFGADVTSHSISGLGSETSFWFTIKEFNSIGSREFKKLKRRSNPLATES